LYFLQDEDEEEDSIKNGIHTKSSTVHMSHLEYMDRQTFRIQTNTQIILVKYENEAGGAFKEA